MKYTKLKLKIRKRMRPLKNDIPLQKKIQALNYR